MNNGFSTMMASLMASIGALGGSENGRAVYPYALGEKVERTGKSPSYTKKGPGRRYMKGPGPKTERERVRRMIRGPEPRYAK